MLNKTEIKKINEFINELPSICTGGGLFMDFIVVLITLFILAIIHDSSNLFGAFAACCLMTVLLGIPYLFIEGIICCCVLNHNTETMEYIEKHHSFFGITFGISGLIWYSLKYKYKLDCISSMAKTDKIIDGFDKLTSETTPVKKSSLNMVPKDDYSFYYISKKNKTQPPKSVLKCVDELMVYFMAIGVKVNVPQQSDRFEAELERKLLELINNSLRWQSRVEYLKVSGWQVIEDNRCRYARYYYYVHIKFDDYDDYVVVDFCLY